MQFETENERLIKMVQYAGEQGLFSVTDELINNLINGVKTENQYILDLATHSHAVQPLITDLQEIYENIDINTATGEGLDKLGRLVDVTRYPAQAPRVKVTVEIALENDAVIHIPPNTEVIVDGQDPALYGTYVTEDDVIIPPGVITKSFIAVGNELGVRPALPVNSVTGVAGYSFISCTNDEEGTSGRNIEEDDDYRQRIRQANAIHGVGTRPCIEDYLNHYDGLDSYCLIPLYDGVGTLKVVCDTFEDELQYIKDGLIENCMIETDYEPECVLPESVALQSLTLTIKRNPNNTSELTDDELIQAVLGQLYTYVSGGNTRDGIPRQGLSVGEALYPSQLVSYLISSFPECRNIIISLTNIVTVEPTQKLRVGNVSVVLQ